MKKTLVGLLLATLSFAAAAQTQVMRCDPNATGSTQYPNVLCNSSGALVVTTSGGGGNTSVVGAGASGSAVSGNPVLVAGSDGTNARTIKTDASGNIVLSSAVLTNGGANASGGGTLFIMGWDGANQRTVRTDKVGAVQISNGIANSYNITAATVVKASAGTLVRVSVIVAGSAAGTVNDTTTTGGAAVGNEIGVIPNTVGVIEYNWPATTGIVVVPGTGQTVAVSYN